MSTASNIVAEWRAEAGCPEHSKPVVERRVASFPPTWRVPLIKGGGF